MTSWPQLYFSSRSRKVEWPYWPHLLETRQNDAMTDIFWCNDNCLLPKPWPISRYHDTNPLATMTNGCPPIHLSARGHRGARSLAHLFLQDLKFCIINLYFLRCKSCMYFIGLRSVQAGRHLCSSNNNYYFSLMLLQKHPCKST